MYTIIILVCLNLKVEQSILSEKIPIIFCKTITNHNTLNSATL